MKTFTEWLVAESLTQPVYHGGRWNGDGPIKVTGKGSLGAGAYFSPDPAFAAQYAKEAGLDYIVEANLNLIKPLVIDAPVEKHPCVYALIQLGLDPEKAMTMVEKIEEQKGYLGKEISSRAMKQGYDGLTQYRNGKLMEIVIWNSQQVNNQRKIPI